MIDMIDIELTDAERYVLTDLLSKYIRPRVAEAVEFAPNGSVDLERAAERVKRLAEMEACAGERKLPREHLSEHIGDLGLWLLEAEECTEEAQELIADIRENDRRRESEEEKQVSTEGAVEQLVAAYAHLRLCEKLLTQLLEAQNAVTA